MMKTETNPCPSAESAASHVMSDAAPAGFAARFSHQVRHLLHILRQVLRGFAAGHPPDDEHPQGRCC